MAHQLILTAGAMVLFFVLLVCAGAAYAASSGRREWRESYRPAWEAFASATDGRCCDLPPRWLRKIKVMLHIGRGNAELAAVPRLDAPPGREPECTRLSIELPTKGIEFLLCRRQPDLELLAASVRTLRRLRFFRSQALEDRLVGAPEVILGVSAFDQNFVLRSEQPAAALALFGDPGLMERLWIAGRPVVDTIWFGRNKAEPGAPSVLTLQAEGIVTDLGHLKALRELAISLDGRLESSTDRP